MTCGQASRDQGSEHEEVVAYNRELALGHSVAIEDDLLGEFLVDPEELVQQVLDHFVKVMDHLVRVAFRAALGVEPSSVKAALFVQATNDLDR